MSFSEKCFAKLSSKENIELSELYQQLPELMEQLLICRKDVSVYLDSVQDRLEEQPKRNKKHISTINAIKYDLSLIEQTFTNIENEELILAEKSYQELVEELNEVNGSLSLVHVVCEIHERLASLKTLNTKGIDYEQALEILNVLKLLTRSIPHGQGLPFLEDLKKIVHEEINNTNNLFKEEFRNNCVLVSELSSSMIKISDNVEILSCLLPVIYKNTSTQSILISLSNFIWEKLFLLVLQNTCEVLIEKKDSHVVLRINVNETDVNKGYDVVYNNMILIGVFLTEHLNYSINDDLYLLNYIGSSIKAPLVETLFQECIIKYVPNDWTILEKFKIDLMKSTEELKRKLEPFGLNPLDWDKIDKIEKCYTQKRCQYLESKGREIMKKDLHTTIEVGHPYDSKKSLELNEIFHCSISSNIPELIELGEEMINEMTHGAIENCKALFITYKGIFFNYADFVAAHHQKLLETIPQQVALFFNNCTYLFLKLREWDEMFETQQTFQELYDISAKGFYQVEEVGRIFFNSFVDDQKKQIENILRETNLHNETTLEKLNDNTEKLFRQCLRQQELLKTVWSKVLSYPIYNETIGDIFDFMCTFIISSLVSVEDIGAVVAENLIEIFKIILNRGPKLFIDSSEIYLYVSQWNKFNELIFVLGASLIDINDRWADGKGPLALHFNPYELKQLIRALFQNSERRAAVLAKIHE